MAQAAAVFAELKDPLEGVSFLGVFNQLPALGPRPKGRSAVGIAALLGLTAATAPEPKLDHAAFVFIHSS